MLIIILLFLLITISLKNLDLNKIKEYENAIPQFNAFILKAFAILISGTII